MRRMDITTYLKKHKITGTSFSQKLGVSPASVSRLRHGVGAPSAELALKIEKVTDGKVTFHDLVGVPPPSKRKRGAQ